MYCKNCGTEMENGQLFCKNCGASMTQDVKIQTSSAPTKHDVPQCTCCGYTGPWKVDSLLRPIDWVLGICLIPFAGAGIFYFITVMAIRANKKRRAKICPQCKARNLWTFIY